MTTDKLDQFYDQYRGSSEEHAELLQTYTRCNGNMRMLFEYMPCSDPELDSHRFMDAIDAAIAEGDLQSTATYAKWRTKASKKLRPADPLKKQSKKADKKDVQSEEESEAALVAAIRNKVCML